MLTSYTFSEEETFPIFENVLKTSGTMTKANPLEETLLQPALKSFFAVFIQYSEGLENKLTRAPLLGLAKSIYYYWKLVLFTCKKQWPFGQIEKVQPRPLFQNCQFSNRSIDSYNLLVSHLSVQWIGLNWSRKLGKKMKHFW